MKWLVGGQVGVSMISGGGSTDAGFQIGPMGEVILDRNLAVGTEFTINTQSGTPVLWMNYLKYSFALSTSEIRPYASGGFLLDFITGGPFFGLVFGGGLNFPVTNTVYIPAEISLGPVFSTPTALLFTITTGIRYYLP